MVTRYAHEARLGPKEGFPTGVARKKLFFYFLNFIYIVIYF